MISMFCARRGASTRCRPWLAAREEDASSRACCSFSAADAAAFLAAPFGSLGFSAKRSESSLSLASSSSPPPELLPTAFLDAAATNTLCLGAPHEATCEVRCIAGYKAAPSDSMPQCMLGDWLLPGTTGSPPGCVPKSPCGSAPPHDAAFYSAVLLEPSAFEPPNLGHGTAWSVGCAPPRKPIIGDDEAGASSPVEVQCLAGG